MLALTDADFSRLHTYIKTSYDTGPSEKRQLVVSRSSNALASHGYRGSSEYMDKILTGRDKEMVTSMLNKLTTNYTCSLHEEAHSRFLQSVVPPSLAKKYARDRTLSIWSAGCSSEKEPYTISMYLKEFFGSQANSWDTRILATDISQQILNKTRNPVYRGESLERLSSSWKQKYFAKNKDNTYIIAPIIKQNMIFQTFSLMNPIRFRRPFDLVFCQNVMIYFGQVTKDTLVQRFYDTTVPDGYLLIGHSESLNKAACPYEYLMLATYRKTRR